MAEVAEIPPLVPVSHAGPKYLGGLSRSTIYQLIGSGDLVRVTIGRRAFITGASIHRFLSQLIARSLNGESNDTATHETGSYDSLSRATPTAPASASITAQNHPLSPN